MPKIIEIRIATGNPQVDEEVAKSLEKAISKWREEYYSVYVTVKDSGT